MYTATFAYGLGGGQRTATTTVRFLYLTWWHVLLLAALAVGGFYGTRVLLKFAEESTIGRPRKPNKGAA
jgi:hypothetical protein